MRSSRCSAACASAARSPPQVAFAMGFDHIALAAGAGKPTVLDMPHGLVRGVRTASDFLMALQLTGAAREESIANLQVRMPIVVVGGGLTAIDTATESLAYYAGAGREVPRALRDAVPRARPRRRAQRMERGGNRGRRGIPHARARDPRGARAREARRPRGRASSSCCSRGAASTIAYRRRLDRQPLVHAQPRGSGEGARGRHLASPRTSRRSAIEVDGYGRARGLAVQAHATDGRRHGRKPRGAAGAHHPHRRGHAAQHGARARRSRVISCSTASTSAPSTRTARP